MDDQIIEPQYVTLVNRLSETREFWGFGRPHVFKAGESRAVSRPFAQWIFTRTDGPMKVHTVEAGYVCWLGIKDGSPDLIGELPESAFDTSPLTVETGRVEGWDTSVVDRDPAKTHVKTAPLQRADFEHQGRASGGSMGAPARVLKES